MAKRNGLLRKRKDGRWEGRIVIGYDDKKLPITKNVTSKSKTECLKKLEQLQKDYAKPDKIISPDITFEEWINYRYQNFRKLNIRVTTQEDYEYEIYRYIIPMIGNIKIKEFKKPNLEQFYADLKAKGLSDRVIKGCHMLCKSMLQDAVKEGIIQKNPADNIKLPNPKPKKIDVLSQEEIQSFLIQAKYEGYFELFLTALMTGMRKGEVLSLKWSDLNLKTGELHIQRQVKRIKGGLS